MSKRVHRASKRNRAQLIVTEDELRARDRAAEARAVAKSEAAADELDAATRNPMPRSPLATASELVQPLWTFSVVFFGLLSGGWSPASVIVCFWFEKLTRVCLMTARIYIHRESTGKRGHYRSHIDTYAGGPERSDKKTFGRALGGNASRLFVHGQAGAESASSKRISPSGAPTLLNQFIGMSLVVELLSLIVIVWALSTMDDWTQSRSVWGFVKQEWQSKAWIIVLPLVIHFVIDTITTLRQRSFASIKAQAMVTHSSASLILPVFLLAMWIANYTETAGVLVFACVLVAAKTIYEVSIILLGRDYELRSGDRLALRLWRTDPTYARYAKKEAAQRMRDEETMR
ncbi:MAG: hypothetical protein EAZ43_07190 [Betaproteobacteria bacterium]|nr:MAG: hypothetical protein EAZ43_07190 [Betaproteobacteria bacterium]